MTEKQEQAIKKIREDKGKPKGREREFMKPYVTDALCRMIEQSEDFAERILADGKTLTACLDGMKVEGRMLSDIEAYKLAAEYFCPDAVIEMEMKIRMPQESQTSAKILNFNLEDFL